MRSWSSCGTPVYSGGRSQPCSSLVVCWSALCALLQSRSAQARSAVGE